MSFLGGGGYSGKGAGAQYAMERVRKLGAIGGRGASNISKDN